MIIVGCASNVTNSCIFFIYLRFHIKNLFSYRTGACFPWFAFWGCRCESSGGGLHSPPRPGPPSGCLGWFSVQMGWWALGEGDQLEEKKTSIIDRNEDELPHTRTPHHYTNRIFTHESQLRGRLNFSNMVIGDDRSELFSSLAVM